MKIVFCTSLLKGEVLTTRRYTNLRLPLPYQPNNTVFLSLPLPMSVMFSVSLSLSCLSVSSFVTYSDMDDLHSQSVSHFSKTERYVVLEIKQEITKKLWINLHGV